jgi:hypothetical protein
MIKGNYLYLYNKGDCHASKLKIYNILPDGTISLTHKFIELWANFQPPFEYGYYPCGGNEYMMPPYRVTRLTSSRIDSGFLYFTRTFPVSVPNDNLSVITQGIVLRLYTNNMLFIPDYVIKYEIIKSLNAEPASELRFYTLFLPDPTLTLMVDSKSHITRYPLVFNRNCIATGKIKLQQYDTVYVYFPYQGYTMNIEVIAVEPEPISCVIDPTTYLKFKSDGCKYSLPVLDSILEPVSILTVPRPKFANIANLVAQTFVNLELPIPLIPITPPNIPQSLKLPTIKYTDSSRYNLQQRQEIREIKNISRIEDMGILNQIQTGGILSLTVSNNGEFLDLIPNDVMGYTSIFNMGNVILGTGATGGSNGDDAIVNFRTGGTPPG